MTIYLHHVRRMSKARLLTCIADEYISTVCAKPHPAATSRSQPTRRCVSDGGYLAGDIITAFRVRRDQESSRTDDPVGAIGILILGAGMDWCERAWSLAFAEGSGLLVGLSAGFWVGMIDADMFTISDMLDRGYGMGGLSACFMGLLCIV